MKAEFVATPEAAGEWLARETRAGDVVLLKASRGVKLEKALETAPGNKLRADSGELTAAVGGGLLYWLLYLKLFHYFPPPHLPLSDVSYRVCQSHRSFHRTHRRADRYPAPARFSDRPIHPRRRAAGAPKKAGTPTMGGLLIAIAILVPTLLWADLGNPLSGSPYFPRWLSALSGLLTTT